MSDLVRNTSPRSKEPQAHSDNEDLPSLVGRLSGDLTELLDLRLSLLKVEIKEEVDAFIRRGVALAAGGVITLIGFALVNIALAFFISSLFGAVDVSQSTRYGLGLVTTGLIYLLTGGVIVAVTKRRLAAQGIVPEKSVKEFEKDKQLVRNVIQS